MEHNINYVRVTGFGECFATSFLLGDIDMNMENIGVIKEGGREFFARIDFGKALSYNAHINDEGTLEYNAKLATLSEFTEEIQDTYTDYLYGIDFAGEILFTIAKFDSIKIEKSLKIIIQNLKEAYGDNFLENPEIGEALRRRMGFKADEMLSEETIKNKLINNMTILSASLNEMAEIEMKKIFPHNPKIALQAYKESYIGGNINYGVFAAKLKEKGIHLGDAEQFKSKFSNLPRKIIAQMKAVHEAEAVVRVEAVMVQPRVRGVGVKVH